MILQAGSHKHKCHPKRCNAVTKHLTYVGRYGVAYQCTICRTVSLQQEGVTGS